MKRRPGKTLLMACSGMGLGNSTRLLAIAQALRSALGARRGELGLVVCTNAAGLEFWSAQAASVEAEVVPLEAYRVRLRPGSGAIDWLAFAGAAALRTYWSNTRAIDAFLRDNAVDLALLDSDYHILPFWARRVPVVALGQAHDVLRRAARAPKGSELPRASLLVERLDALFQRWAAQTVLVPSFEPSAGSARKVVDIPLIVRRAFEDRPLATAGPSGRVVVLLGGSGVGSSPLRDYARERGWSVIGPGGRSEAWDERGAPLIDSAAVVVTQGGLSSISECLARRKPMIVVPIAGHAEQLLNALEVERLGAGVAARDVREVARALTRLPAEPASRPPVDGAGAAARLLLRRLGLGD